ncbi:protein transport protein SEC16B homolog [Abrus precatorius]|uniref:Protein transport protein sec16 n=1 Tax=Abrus precatorius TaxID=3816 RepID=A0A8B8JTF5_ABRPR|nr:protein transport protein SEC16B homolog [Abrus precatorius]
MASNPPFHVEDQTDEDFFDKLVEDDIEPVKSGNDDEGHDSDDVKAFASLGISDDSGESGIEMKREEEEEGGVKLDGGNAQEGSFLVPSSSFECDSAMDHGDRGTKSEITSSLTVSKSNGMTDSGVKEVDWNSFYADSNGDVGFGSYSDFFSDLGDQSGKTYHDSNTEVKTGNEIPNDGLNSSANHVQYQEDQGYDASLGNSTDGQDLSSGPYWENLYPGWKYDHSTGQWYQVDDHNASIGTQGSSEANTAVDWTAASDMKAEVSYMQQTAQSVSGTLVETGSTESVSSWNQVSQGNGGYPEHMVFDPQYPGWYYDTIAQEWRLLETYNSSIQSAVQGLENGHASTSTLSQNVNNLYREYGQAGNYGTQGVGSQVANNSWSGSYGVNHQQGLDTHTSDTLTKSGDGATTGGNQQFEHSFGTSISVNKNQLNTSSSFGTVALYNKVNHDHGLANGTLEPQNFAPSGHVVQHFNYSNTQFDERKKYLDEYAESQKPFSYSQAQQSFQGGNQYSYAPHVGRSSAGRPPHALVTFGFGGKLIVMKDSTFSNSSYGSQTAVQGSVSVLNLMEVVKGNINSSSIGNGTGDYFHALCQQSFPGPLVGGSVGSKELYKWIDERIAHCRLADMDYKKGERLRLLLSLLRIACQHYGKLRSPFGTDTILRENDTPESAVAKLFASAKMSGKEFTQYGELSHCLQNLPSEAQMLTTASEVQNLLVSGKKKEALQCAQEGQLWGPALVLASRLGDQFYVDTVKQMALRQLVLGSPLRTLCLLIAGQPAEVFSSDSSVSGDPRAFNMPQQPTQLGSNGMLDDWEENLAVITANRTKDDELVIIHLGDCLWKERSEIIAAHICYLVAEANFGSYSDSARLCLVGADHWKFPRTYASPEAIQMTELYEYAKVLGNSQFILLPFQPYKLIYAYMLAELGKVSDSLKYCQAVLKSLKTGRAPEVETWKQLVFSLEERIRTHQQGGYTANLAPAKLVGKLLNFFDSTAHRVVGGLPPPAPSSSQGVLHGNGQHYQPTTNRVSNSQSTMAMSSLVPSASMEPISDWTADSNRTTKPNRSVSEPDFSRSPRQGASPDAQGKASVSGGTSRFSFGFGSQLLQKTVGLVLRPRPGRQAKLGEKNKFYYDEKLKRWVEEGAEPPPEETALPPPPTTAAFPNGSIDYNLKSALKNERPPSNEGSDLSSSELTPGIPPIPPSTNQFSARGRFGVRSRYVDTFNQGGGSSANLFQSPSVPSVKSALAANPKFFIPAPAPSSNEQAMEAIAESNQEDSLTNEIPSTSSRNDWSYQSPQPPSAATRQRFPSMSNISIPEAMTDGSNSHLPHSRRTASWGGDIGNIFSPTEMGEIKPLGEALGMPPTTFIPDEFSLRHTPTKSGSFGEDLHEVKL